MGCHGVLEPLTQTIADAGQDQPLIWAKPKRMNIALAGGAASLAWQDKTKRALGRFKRRWTAAQDVTGHGGSLCDQINHSRALLRGHKIRVR